MTSSLSTCLHHIHESLILVIFRIFFLLFLVNSLYGVGILLIFFYNLDINYRSLAFTTLSLGHSLLFLVELCFVTFFVVHSATKVYYITEHQLIERRGLMKIEEHSYELTHIRAVHLEQSLLGKVFGYGNLILTLATSGYREDVKIKDITDPKKYERIVRDYIEKANDIPPKALA